MSKLRLVSEEEQIIPSTSANSGPSIFLRIKNHAVQSSFSAFLTAYDLEIELCGKGEILLWSKNKTSGSHKRQALYLFYAALEVHSCSSTAQCFIYEFNPIKKMIDPTQKLEEKLIKTWTKSQEHFSLDSSVSFYLNEAGLKLGDAKTELNHVTHETLKQIQQEIISRNSSANSSIRKSA